MSRVGPTEHDDRLEGDLQPDCMPVAARRRDEADATRFEWHALPPFGRHDAGDEADDSSDGTEEDPTEERPTCGAWAQEFVPTGRTLGGSSRRTDGASDDEPDPRPTHQVPLPSEADVEPRHLRERHVRSVHVTNQAHLEGVGRECNDCPGASALARMGDPHAGPGLEGLGGDHLRDHDQSNDEGSDRATHVITRGKR
jgi:hypothetical protein